MKKGVKVLIVDLQLLLSPLNWKSKVGDERTYLRSEVYTSNLGQFYQLVKSLLVAKVAQGKFLKEELEVYQYLKRGSILFHLRSKNLKNKIQVLL